MAQTARLSARTPDLSGLVFQFLLVRFNILLEVLTRSIQVATLFYFRIFLAGLFPRYLAHLRG